MQPQILHCYIDAGPAEAGELSTEEALRLVDQMAEVGVPLILFTGGEPPARPDFFQIAARAGELGIKLVLSTNGTLITPDVAKRLKELGFVYFKHRIWSSLLENFMLGVCSKFRGLRP